MSEEEKQAIEYLQNQDNSLNWNYGTLQAILQVLNYIDKLQKELKDSINARFELQRRIDKTQKENAELKEQRDNAIKLRNELIEEQKITCISKDKIKETLGDKNIPDEMILTYIDTLVSENNRLEDIEDRKVQIEYNNVFNKGVKSVEDKIRTKIKELEEQQAIEIEETGMSLLSVPIRILEELLN